MDRSDFTKGITMHLPIPECVRREWRMNGYAGNGRDEQVEEDFTASVGYAFEWGQIIEELYARDEGDERDERGFIGARWHFVLTDLHSAFLDAGRDLGKLSDMVVSLWDRICADALTELSVGEQAELLPEFIELDEGNTISAFEIMVIRAENVARAREWVASFFIPGVLPLLMDWLRDANRAAPADDLLTEEAP